MSLLERVDQPADLLRLTVEDLEQLAGEIRGEILRTMSVTPGHLSSNLGVVELTLALHYTFDSPRDRFLFDVGHQCYTHKLVTGRRERFGTIRKAGGLSGFPDPAESVHDSFHTGHAGTSLSSALGLAVARDLRGEDFKVVAVIGDGSLPNGMSLEAMNHIGHLKPDLTVVLNDNEMAISRTVGAIAAYLGRIMTGHFYSRLREQMEKFLKRFQRFGPPMMVMARHLEADIKGLFGPGVLFEQLGFRYMGPYDGHDMKLLIEVFRNARKLKGPTLIHVVTKKGKGYPHAEADPIAYYSPAGFDVASGRLDPPSSRVPTYSEVYTQTLIKLADQDPRVVSVTAAMLEGTKLKYLQEKYPERSFDVGIAEEHAVTFAAAMASRGLRPFVALYSTFLQRAYDQVMHDVCLQGLPVVLAMDRAGLVGDDGPTHHGVFDFAYLRHLPNLVVMAPSDENELAKMMALAAGLGKPSSIRFPRGPVTGTAMDTVLSPVPLGRGRLVREGGDLAIVAAGTMLAPALEVAERLQAESGIGAAVADARFVKPLDADLIAGLAARCGRIVTMEEHSRVGGFGSAVLELLAERGVMVPALVIALPDAFVEHGPIPWLKEKHGLSVPAILDRIRSFMDAPVRRGR